jgi:hypothetical protein
MSLRLFHDDYHYHYHYHYHYKLGVKKVYFGCHNDRFGGNGSILSVHTDIQKSSTSTSTSTSTSNVTSAAESSTTSIAVPDYRCSYEVVPGILKEQAIELFQRFYTMENRRAPVEKRKRCVTSFFPLFNIRILLCYLRIIGRALQLVIMYHTWCSVMSLFHFILPLFMIDFTFFFNLAVFRISFIYILLLITFSIYLFIYLCVSLSSTWLW